MANVPAGAIAKLSCFGRPDFLTTAACHRILNQAWARTGPRKIGGIRHGGGLDIETVDDPRHGARDDERRDDDEEALELVTAGGTIVWCCLAQTAMRHVRIVA